MFLTFVTYSGEASAANGGNYTLYSIAAVVLGGVSLFGGSGSAIGAIFGALDFRTIGDLLFVFDFDPLWQPLFQGVVLMAAVSLGAVRLFRVRNRLDVRMSDDARRRRKTARVAACAGSIPRSRWPLACIVAAAAGRQPLLAQFPSPEYLLQQLKVASFLGVIASGMMLVILLGQIDLSVPWMVAIGGMMASAATAHGPVGAALADAVRRRCAASPRPRQRRRRRLSAHSLDDHHARHQRGRARVDGGLHRRLLAAGLGLARDALLATGRHAVRRAERGARLGGGRRPPRCSC